MNTADRQVIDMVNNRKEREERMAKMAKRARYRKQLRRQARQQKKRCWSKVLHGLACVAVASGVALLMLKLSILAI